jgi:hypothetical protein
MRRRLLGLPPSAAKYRDHVGQNVAVTRQAVVKHPGWIAGLVHGRKTGREVRYLVRPDALGPAPGGPDRGGGLVVRLARRIAEAGAQANGG